MSFNPNEAETVTEFTENKSEDLFPSPPVRWKIREIKQVKELTHLSVFTLERPPVLWMVTVKSSYSMCEELQEETCSFRKITENTELSNSQLQDQSSSES